MSRRKPIEKKTEVEETTYSDEELQIIFQEYESRKNAASLTDIIEDLGITEDVLNKALAHFGVFHPKVGADVIINKTDEIIKVYINKAMFAQRPVRLMIPRPHCPGRFNIISVQTAGLGKTLKLWEALRKDVQKYLDSKYLIEYGV